MSTEIEAIRNSSNIDGKYILKTFYENLNSEVKKDLDCVWDSKKNSVNKELLNILETGKVKDQFQIISFDQDTEDLENYDSYISLLRRMFSSEVSENIYIWTKNTSHKGILYSNPILIKEIGRSIPKKNINIFLLKETPNDHDNLFLRIFKDEICKKILLYKLYEEKEVIEDGNIVKPKKESLNKKIGISTDDYLNFRCIVDGYSAKITNNLGKTIFIFNVDKCKNREILDNFNKLKNFLGFCSKINNDYKMTPKEPNVNSERGILIDINQNIKQMSLDINQNIKQMSLDIVNAIQNINK